MKSSPKNIWHIKKMSTATQLQLHTVCADEPSSSTCKHSKLEYKRDKKNKTEHSHHCDFNFDKRIGLSLIDSFRTWSDTNSIVPIFYEQNSGKEHLFYSAYSIVQNIDKSSKYP